MNKLGSKLSGLWDWIPLPCVLCQQLCDNHFQLCTTCYQTLPWRDPSWCCRWCGQDIIVQQSICGQCLRTKPAFDAVWSPFHYDETLKYLVSAFKFKQQLWAGHILATLMTGAYHRQQPQPQSCLIPVPLHWTRHFRRGFNQSLILAEALAKTTGMPCISNALCRCRRTASQSQLAHPQRKSNVRGAFSVEKFLVDMTVIIIDDVMTTGMTVNEVAIQLKKAGVRRVEIWCLARASGNHRCF